MRRPKQARNTDRYPRLKNVLPCDYSRVDRAGTVKPANRGAREVPTSNVNTTKQRTQHSHPEGRATEHPNMDHPKAAKTRLIAGRKRAERLKHEARRPVELVSPTQRTEEPESHPRKGGHWKGNPELKAPREKRKRPGETGRPGTSEQEPQGWRTSLER